MEKHGVDPARSLQETRHTDWIRKVLRLSQSFGGTTAATQGPFRGVHVRAGTAGQGGDHICSSCHPACQQPGEMPKVKRKP